MHWTGKPHRLSSLVRIDGKALRIMGKEPAGVPALPQTGLVLASSGAMRTMRIRASTRI
jgi:hypothetical protein